MGLKINFIKELVSQNYKRRDGQNETPSNETPTYKK